MVRALLVLVRAVRQAWLVEVAGAGLIVAGVYEGWGLAAAFVAAGVALVLKATDLDVRGDR